MDRQASLAGWKRVGRKRVGRPIAVPGRACQIAEILPELVRVSETRKVRPQRVRGSAVERGCDWRRGGVMGCEAAAVGVLSIAWVVKLSEYSI